MSDEKSLTSVSVSTILKRNVCLENENDEKKIAALLQLTHIRLDRENIQKIENLDCLGHVTNLYLQQNCIEVIENLDCLSSSLRFLTLSGNMIKQVQGLCHLNLLGFLDLSDNEIDNIDQNELPQSLVFVSFKNNRCASLPNYREDLMRQLPNLKSVDNEFVGEESSDDESLESDENEISERNVKEVCMDLLEHSSIRLEEIVEQHKERLKEIETRKSCISHPPALDSHLTEANLCKFQDNVQTFLQTMIDVERGVMEKDKFDLLDHNYNDEVIAENAIDNTSFRGNLSPTPSTNSEKLEFSIFNSNDPSKKSSQLPTYVSVGTTTSRTVSTPEREHKDISSKALLRKKVTAKPHVPLTVNKPKPGFYKSKHYSNVQSKIDSRLNTPNSLMRIPGARPFHKQ